MITRRTVLAAAGAVAAGLPLAQPSAAAGRGPTVGPRVLARRRAVSAAGVRVDATAFPLSHLTVQWRGPDRPAFRARFASGWGDWTAVRSCGAGRDDKADATGSALLAAPGAVGYDIASAPGSGTTAVVELNAGTGPINPTAEPLRVAGRDPGGVRYLNRAAWRADESLRFGSDGSETWPAEYFPVQTLTVHHTATTNDDPDPAATMRAIYYYHAVTLGWGDVGYHLLIDEAGRVYEGRWSGPDPVPALGVDVGPDGRPPMVNAGHVGGYNAGNIGVAILGDLTDRLPTTAARRSLAALLAVLAGVERLNPSGTTRYVNPISGATATVDTISGHRDWLATECPGNRFYPQLPSLRRDVARLLR
ncbi:peptidoglycan recognition protein family protein [Virgisporangium aurantiacum]|uniref:N-acetylmuramoyl-L-alanine amidase n=1 Tax=Virgisporangium aurantiacum TaxID=175570 RepID=A0A8J3Z8F6_9ACTN|nr:N-acetylmuramoyl-L-alanine amidase [Virgisporangium aurantiacum]GIJ57126.1 hypothetical protein Vau01_046420 [Virgisporangium aurantiacum]